jgi:protein-tyrosine phosphatase
MRLSLLFNLLFCGLALAVNTTETEDNTTNNSPAIAWFSLKAGKICLGKKPDAEAYSKLKDLGVTHLATVQTGEEQAPTVRDNALENGLEWLWVPFTHPSAQSPTDDVHLHHYLHELSKMLSEGASIYLHCDGSQHRCSLLFYALCHYAGIPSNSAYNALHSFGRNAANNLSRSELTWAAELGHTAPHT